MTDIQNFLVSLLAVVNAMSPYLLLGFFIAGVLHVYVPGRFYARYLSRDNKLSVVWAALLGIPLPLCSCGVTPTAVGLKKENASNGAVASFLIATPQTGIDSILATFSLMGLGFAVVRPVAALVTGVCGGLLVNRLMRGSDEAHSHEAAAQEAEKGCRLWRVLRYAYVDMLQDIGPRLVVGLLLAALINVAVPDEFFLTFGSQPLLQMLAVLVLAVPMYICSTGSIPVAAALIMKGVSPGAALVMLMAGPAVNLGSILVVKKAMGSRFTAIYLSVIVVFSVLFGLLVNALGIGANIGAVSGHAGCCGLEEPTHNVFGTICSCLLIALLAISLVARAFHKHEHHDGECGGATCHCHACHDNHA